MNKVNWEIKGIIQLIDFNLEAQAFLFFEENIVLNIPLGFI